MTSHKGPVPWSHVPATTGRHRKGRHEKDWSEVRPTGTEWWVTGPSRYGRHRATVAPPDPRPVLVGYQNGGSGREAAQSTLPQISNPSDECCRYLRVGNVRVHETGCEQWPS